MVRDAKIMPGVSVTAGAVSQRESGLDDIRIGCTKSVVSLHNATQCLGASLTRISCMGLAACA